MLFLRNLARSTCRRKGVAAGKSKGTIVLGTTVIVPQEADVELQAHAEHARQNREDEETDLHPTISSARVVM